MKRNIYIEQDNQLDFEITETVREIKIHEEQIVGLKIRLYTMVDAKRRLNAEYNKKG